MGNISPMINAAQLGKIAARIESIHDGEALAAARMLVKRLGGHGLRLPDIIERGVSGGGTGGFVGASAFQPRQSPSRFTHRTKIDALLSDVHFLGEYLTRRSVSRLQSLYRADHLDPANMSWVDGLLEKAREMREGRTRK